jgi:hypothetical protein
MGPRVVRSWPWTLALAAPMTGFVALGLFAMAVRTDPLSRLLVFVGTAAAGAALARTLSTGVQLSPSGLVIRELTRTSRVPWARVRAVTSRPTARKGVHAPVLHLIPERAVKGGRRGRAAEQDLELTVLASYRESVARARADRLAQALAGTRTRP